MATDIDMSDFHHLCFLLSFHTFLSLLSFFLKVPPPVPKKPNVLLLPTSIQSSTNGSTEQQISQTDSPVGLRCPVGVFPPDENTAAPGVPELPEQDENHLGTDEDSSKESSLQSSLQDSSLTELEGKLVSTGIGSGMSALGLQKKLFMYFFFVSIF